MNLDKSINRNVAFYFIGFLILAILAFWPGYFGRVFGPLNAHLHRHGITMTLWLILLISQAYLIRKRNIGLHRMIGKSSYIVAPLVMFAALDLIHFRFFRIQQFSPESLYALALMINGVVAFGLLYGLAIYFKKNSAMHARFMISTVFPLFSPVTDRLIYRFFRDLVPMAPRIGRAPIVPVYGFILADLIVIGLILWDWRIHRRLNVFPIVLIILLAYHLSVLTFHQFDPWEAVCSWFVSLPLQ